MAWEGFMPSRVDTGEAEPLYRRAMVIRERTLDSEHPDLAESLYGLATLYVALARYAKAEEFFQRARAIEEKILGPEHPDLAITLGSLAELYRVQGRFSELRNSIGERGRSRKNVRLRAPRLSHYPRQFG